MITIKDIKRVVADYYGIKVRDLEGPWQRARLVRARQMAIYLARQMTLKSVPQIARAFGGRDHKTIMWSIARIETLLLRNSNGLRGDL